MPEMIYGSAVAAPLLAAPLFGCETYLTASHTDLLKLLSPVMPAQSFVHNLPL